MKYQGAIVAALATSASAFPFMAGGNREELLRDLMEKREAMPEPAPEPQSTTSSILGSLAGATDAVSQAITGLLGSVASNVKGSDLRPEPGYTFQAPGSSDSRGPCPGLNLLANYNYLPRNGYVSFGQVLDATARGFNMATDLATVLGVFAVLADGDLVTEKFYLGAGPGNVGGLNRHSTVEADVSPNREDYYNGCGDNHHLSSRLFKQNVAFAKAAASKQFDMDVMGSQYSAIAQFSKTYNPYLYYFPFPMIVSLGAFAFYPNFFSNGTYGLGGVANYESISSIIGAQWDSSKKEFKYVPEQWPKNWYRRATPYGAVDTLLDGYLRIYPRNIIVPGVSQFATPNLNASTVLCDFYQGINSILPLFVAGGAEAVAAAATWVASKLEPAFGGTVAGCPTSTLSQNVFYPNANTKGGPLNPPSAVVANSGNNVYNKYYFTGTAGPTTPKC